MAQSARLKLVSVPVPASSEPEQGRLFDTGICLETLRREAADLQVQQLAAATREAYEYAWDRWVKWCADSGRRAMPAAAEALELWAVHMVTVEGLALGSVRLWLAGIRHRHRAAGQAIDCSRAVNMLQLARRRGQGLPRPKRAMTLEALEAISRQLLLANDDQAARDRAMLLLAFSGAFRRSELVGLDAGDIEQRPEGCVLTLRRSKTDQVRAGRVVGVRRASRALLCPVRALRVWLIRRGDGPGPLFHSMTRNRGGRLKADAVAYVVKSALRRAGITGDAARGFSSHSFRAGFVTNAAAAGASVPAIMAVTGHKSVAMVERYVRPASAFAFDPLRGVL